jgi:hypothetical protein
LCISEAYKVLNLSYQQYNKIKCHAIMRIINSKKKRPNYFNPGGTIPEKQFDGCTDAQGN